MAGARKQVDWEAVERDYRTGHFTDRELGSRYGVHHSAVQKHARTEGWSKNLDGAIRAATEAKVLSAQVAKGAQTEVAKLVASKVAKELPKSQAAVDAIADRLSRIEIRQQNGFEDLWTEATALLAELRWQRENSESLERLAEIVTEEAGTPQQAIAMRQAFERVCSFTGRVANLAKLVDSLVKATPIERAINKLDAKDGGANLADKPMGDAEAANRMAFILNSVRARVPAEAQTE